MVEMLDSEEEEETKGRGMTRSWLKKRGTGLILQTFYENCNWKIMKGLKR